MKNNWIFTLVLLLFFTVKPHAENEDTVDLSDTSELNALLEQLNELNELNEGLEYKQGNIQLDNEIAYLDLSTRFKFLGASDARKVLEQIWGNPPDESVIGMIFPATMSPLSDSFTYAIEISYSEEGFVKDDDAEEIDYDELLQQMQKDAEDENSMRSEQGYPTVQLVGWASPPFYDKENKKLHWAKELAFEGEETHTLNYNIRVLGRKGYLNLNVIGDMESLPLVQANIEEILASVHFNEGHRYADFNPDLDKLAAYGIGGLIAGKVLAKVGLLAKIGVFFVKFLKPILIGLVALFAAFRQRIFGRSSR